MSDILMPKGPGLQGPNNAVMERLRRRISGYRKHHEEVGPRFDHTVNGLNEQQKQETLALRQRFLESKSKKTGKKSEKNKQQQQQQDAGAGNSVSQKLQKRHFDGSDLGSGGGGNGGDNYEPPAKIPACGSDVNGSLGSANSISQHHQGQSPSCQAHPGEMSSGGSMQNMKSLMKAPGSVPSSSSVPHNINSPASAGGCGSGGGGGPPSNNSTSYSTNNSFNIEFKQEVEFPDLDECAAALEKDAADGSIISGLMGMGDDTNDGMINYDTLKDLISEISDNPDFLKDCDDFDDDHHHHKNLTSTLSFSTATTNHHHQQHHPPSLPQHHHQQHHHSTNIKAPDSSSSAFGSQLSSSSSTAGPTPVAPVTPTSISSSRLNSMVKKESDGNNVLASENGCGNRGLSHCAGPSPAAASTASPLASQLNSHQPSQTPPYSSGSASIFDSASPSGAQGQSATTPLTPGDPNYPSGAAPHGSAMGSKVTRVPYTSPSNSLSLDSPAAQTLKQMAEQHQHKTQQQLGINTFKPNPGSNSSPARSPFNGDSYGFCGGGAGGDFNSGGNSGGGTSSMNSGGGSAVTNSSSSSSSSAPPYSSVRTQSSGSSVVPGVSDNMGMTMPPIKQEANMYSHQGNFNNSSMDHGMNKRAANSNHPRHPLPPGGNPHKIPAKNSTRMPNSVMLQQQHQQQQQQQQLQQPPMYSNKSFNHASNSSGSQQQQQQQQLGPGASVSASHMANSPHNMQPFMNRSPNPAVGGGGMGVVPPPPSSVPPNNNYPPPPPITGYNQGGNTNHSASNVQQQQQQHLNQTQQHQQQQIPQPNPAASLPVSASGSQQQQQQMGASGDMKSTASGGMSASSVQSGNYYYGNQGTHSQMHHGHHPQQQQHQVPQSQQHQVSGTPPPPFMTSNAPVQSNNSAGHPHMGGGGSNPGQTINFTQQHLRMSTGIPPGGPVMNRMMGPGPGVQGPGSGGHMTRMGMPSRMGTPPGAGGNGGMNDMGGMGARMDMQTQQQQRMMRHQQIRGQSMPQVPPQQQQQQQQQQQMMRPIGPSDMMNQQQQHQQQHQQQQMMSGPPQVSNMMNRFPNMNSNPPTGPSGPGRPGMGPGGGPGMMGTGGPGQIPRPNMTNLRMQGSMYGPGQGMPSGNSNNMPTGMGNMSMAMRHRMPSYNTSAPPGVVGHPGPSNPNLRPGMNHSMMMSSSGQHPPPPHGPSNEWMGMQGDMRNYHPGASMQQSYPNSMRPNPNHPGFHQGMPMQMPSEHHQQHHPMGQMQRGDGPMCNPSGVPGQPGGGMPGNPQQHMSYGQQQKPPPQQQQMSMGGNPGNFPQMPPMSGNKMPGQSQQQPPNVHMATSNFTMKTGAGMTISNSGGSGGTMMMSANPSSTSSSQPMNQMCHTNNNSNNHPINNKTSNSNNNNNPDDFNFDLLENITSGDASSFNADTDFLSSFDSNSIFNSL